MVRGNTAYWDVPHWRKRWSIGSPQKIQTTGHHSPRLSGQDGCKYLSTETSIQVGIHHYHSTLYNIWTGDRMTTNFMLLYFALALICTLYLQETSRKPLKDKLKNFLEVCSKFQPVMRYFFIENFSQPSVWFERRLAYTKSVSTTSIGTVDYIIEIYYTTYWNTCDYCSVQYIHVIVICFVTVGYILGLGDRHIQNILIDTNTAELVHIDLGMLLKMLLFNWWRSPVDLIMLFKKCYI